MTFFGGIFIRGRVSISVYFAAFIACVLVLDSSGLAAFALFCVLIHECGHIAVLRILHIPVESVSIKLFGINISLKSGTVLSYPQEIALSLSGCAANFITCIPAGLLYFFKICPRQSGAILIFGLMLGCFNLLPIGSLDGGRALESALCRKMSCVRAEIIVDIVSVLLIIPLTCAGVYVVAKTGYNISLIAAAVYLAAGLVAKSGLTSKLPLKSHKLPLKSRKSP